MRPWSFEKNSEYIRFPLSFQSNQSVSETGESKCNNTLVARKRWKLRGCLQIGRHCQRQQRHGAKIARIVAAPVLITLVVEPKDLGGAIHREFELTPSKQIMLPIPHWQNSGMQLILQIEYSQGRAPTRFLFLDGSYCDWYDLPKIRMKKTNANSCAGNRIQTETPNPIGNVPNKMLTVPANKA